jgi:cytochrome c-type biogenesis protein CcmH/NrfG
LNPPAPTDWTSAIAILAGGLVLGLLVAYFFSKRKTTVVRDDLHRKDLEARRDALVQQLRDESISNAERQRLERETADVLRELDAQAPAAAPTAPASAPLSMNPTIKGFLYGATSVAAIALLGWYVMREAKPRQEGGSVTGNLPGEMQQQPAAQAQQQPDPALAQLLGAVQQQPENLQLRNDLAQAYLERDNLMAVFEQTKFVLEKAPNDARALTFQALVRMSMGEADTAEKMLQHATQSDPKNLDGWVALAWVYTQQNKHKEAEAMIAAAAKNSPADAPRLQQVYQQMKAQASGAPAQTASTGELPPGHPSVDGTPAGNSVTVTLDLDPSAQGKSGVLFVMARNPAGGPPYAVKRLNVSSFPTTITIGQADSMMGQQLPNTFRLEARLDSDGNATTKPPSDPSALQDNVVTGSSVRLALK